VLVDPEAAAAARAALRELGSRTQVESGEQALAAAASAPNVQMVMAAIVGAAGLASTLAAVRAGKRVFLANKEALVMTGRLLMDEVRRAGEVIDLSPTEFALLRYLMANSGRVLSKAQILDHVWQYDFNGDSGIVESYISYLRKKVDRFEPPLIHTLRGVGYSLRMPRG